MNGLGKVLVLIGSVLFVYALIGRFVNGPTVFGFLMAMDPRTVVLGANTIIVLGIAALLLEKK